MTVRKPWQGVANIVAFNFPVYVAATAVIGIGMAVAVVAVGMTAPIIATVATIAAVMAVVMTAGSLVASYVSYDRSGLYEWRWLSTWLPQPMSRWAHVHTGLDESSDTLRQQFPDATLHIFDASDTHAQPEPSIARARAIVPVHPDTIAVGLAALPVADLDVVLLPMAAHEVRDDAVRAKWLRQLADSMSSDGRMMVIEHLRDVPNALAFHVGVMHFLSRATWLRTFAAAGLVVVREQRIAAFLWVFSLRKEGHGHS
jgi:hypothetical protein